MKKSGQLFVIFMILFGSVRLAAQPTNLVFFTEQGERFSVVLNGVLQNGSPETNIKITGLPAPSYKLKVIFEDQKIPELDKTLMYQQGTETTFNIRKNNKGEYVVRFLNQVPIEEVMPPPPAQKIYVYTTVPATTIINNTQINQTTVSSTTVNNTNVNNTSVSAGGDINMNMNVSGGSVSTSTSSTSMTVASTVSVQNNGEIQPNYDHHPLPPDHYVMPGYDGPIGCPHPITDLDFADVRRSIASKSFEDSKLTIAKEVTAANCLFSSEVKEIMLLFSFESTRLEYAEFAYKYTYDQGNYYKVNDAFQFESSIDELRDYLHGRDH